MYAISNVLADNTIFLYVSGFQLILKKEKKSFYTSSTNRSHTKKKKKKNLKILEPVEKPQAFKCRKS